MGILLLSPIVALVCFLVWVEDRHSPFYIAPRVGRAGRRFKMVKLRSMTVDADKSRIDSTARGDERITRIGHVIRKFKLDELSQLWNVLIGDMSLVGPRPQIESDVQFYTQLERQLLDVRPGITDFASIVFADEGDILEGTPDPDLRYNQLIRPWKSRFGLHYIASRGFFLDVCLILVTLLNVFSRRRALAAVAVLLERTGAEPSLIAVARRNDPLVPAPPSGADEIVRTRVPNAGSAS